MQNMKMRCGKMTSSVTSGYRSMPVLTPLWVLPLSSAMEAFRPPAAALVAVILLFWLGQTSAT